MEDLDLPDEVIAEAIVIAVDKTYVFGATPTPTFCYLLTSGPLLGAFWFAVCVYCIATFS